MHYHPQFSYANFPIWVVGATAFAFDDSIVNFVYSVQLRVIDAHRLPIGGTELVEGLEVGLRGVYVAVPREDKRIHEDGIEVQDLEEGSLPHESLQGGCPPLPDGLETVQVSTGLLVQFRSALGS